MRVAVLLSAVLGACASSAAAQTGAGSEDLMRCSDVAFDERTFVVERTLRIADGLLLNASETRTSAGHATNAARVRLRDLDPDALEVHAPRSFQFWCRSKVACGDNAARLNGRPGPVSQGLFRVSVCPGVDPHALMTTVRQRIVESRER